MNLPSKTKAFLRLIAVLPLVFLFACAKNYVTKHRQFRLISEKTEIEIGRKAKEDILKQYGTYKDLDWQVYLDEVGQRVAKASDRPNLQYDFTIIDSNEINAFALPGGFIFVTRGILPHMADEAELAIVLGHEITHVAAVHGVEMLQKAGLLSTLTALGTIGGIAMGAGGAAIAIAQAAGIYENLYLVGYGRGNELEADHYGIYYAARAGYDPGAALTFFKRLGGIEKEEEAGQHLSPYWRSHPPTEVRLGMAEKWVAQVEQQEGSHLAFNYNRDKFLAMVARLPQGTPAERGIVTGNHYKNKVFGIDMDAPQGWKLENNRVQSLVGFVGPIDEVRGELLRTPLPRSMSVQEFAKEYARQTGIHDVLAREVEYPAGHGLLWQYGGSYLRYRTLILVHGKVGYTMTCQIPEEQFLQYVVDCEKIFRSLQLTASVPPEPRAPPVTVIGSTVPVTSTGTKAGQ